MLPSNVAVVSALVTLLAPYGSADPAPPIVDVDVTVLGRVSDARTGAPLAGAQVVIEAHSIGALTNTSGSYVLALGDSWIAREVTVTARMIGYAASTRTIRLAEGGNGVDFALEPVPLALDELVVTADAQAAARRAPVEAVGGLTIATPQALPGRYDPNLQRESYAHIVENTFLDVAANPLSTFSIDVDRASYSNMRRFIDDGMRPPIDAVRIEELVNYFAFSDPGPDDDAPVRVTTEVAPAPWQPLHHLVRIGLKARAIDMSDAPANNLVFLIDVSGSMNRPDKLPLLKTAFGMLVEQLRPRDRVAIVVYAGAAGLVLPSTPGNRKDTILEAIARLEAGGSTAGGAGIRLAYAVAAENHIEGGTNRVILATDGDFNVGASSDSEMVRLIEEKREQGTFLTVLGFGTGNLQDAKMEQIADHGNGNYAYIDGPLEAKKVLVHEIGGTLVTVAQDVKMQVEFNPARVAAYRLIGYENRLLAAEDFDDDTKDAGELGAGHSVTALYEVIPVGVESPVDVREAGPLRYRTTGLLETATPEGELLFVKLRYQEPGGSRSRLLAHAVDGLSERPSDDFRFAAAVAAWGMLLRDSEHCRGFTLDDVARLARGALGEDEGGHRAEFVRLVHRVRSLELLAMDPGAR